MKNLSKCSKILIGLGCFIIIASPIILYYSLSANCGFDAIGGEKAPEVWLGFWASFIGAIASLLMVFFTWLTLRQNKLQLNQLIHQWEEQNKPILSCSAYEDYESLCYFFHITNIGSTVAYNISFNFNDEFFNRIECPNIRDYVKKECSKVITRLIPNRSYTIKIVNPQKVLDKSGLFRIGGKKYKKSEISKIIKILKSNPIEIYGSIDGKHKFYDKFDGGKDYGMNTYVAINNNIASIVTTLSDFTTAYKKANDINDR